MITKDNNLKVMEFFFKFPYKTFHIRELARLTGLSSTGIIKIVERLKLEKLLVTNKTRNIEEVKPDFNGRFLFIKKLYNLYSLYDSGLIDLLNKYYEVPKAIILFGSYSKGTDTEESDIDLAIISSKKETPEFKKFEKKLARRINLYLISIDKAEKEFKNSLANGVVLEGFMEVLK